MTSLDFIYKWSSRTALKGYKVESFEEARKEYKKLLEEWWLKTWKFIRKQKWIGTLPKIWHFLKRVARKFQSRELIMKKDIYSNIRDGDALEDFFECITSCSINSEGVDCTTACYVRHLEPNNIGYPLKFI